ncbi:MAG: DNA primase DnaG [Candidatus Nezhaarchaeota archaeon]|nr:DNA primase DnaG [Candidatus Nezhaarchaeota archaeon]MCX8142046.1 DNA primase DnaG [Candidatus Nezhaarchaeota archaeon]MDW8050173.1 DNA primase DnaG [Nitrososphaerota archaeon]
MGGVAITAKYVIYAAIEIDGIVDKSDVIGALFGQTEGLLGDKLDLRELQKMGRIGRVHVVLEEKGNKCGGIIEIPSNLDRVETALIAAAIETVDKVGPYDAKVTVTKIEDVREEKRKKIVERAKELLAKWKESLPDTREITEEILKAVREAQLIAYGSEKLPAGPDIDKSDTIIIVEGRADVVNLLRHDYRNVIAIEGASIPKTIINLSKEKTTIAFIDGDRGGELVLRKLIQVADVDYVARAPPGKEVEELTGKEIAKCLRDKVSLSEYLTAMERAQPAHGPVEGTPKISLTQDVLKEVEKLKGSLESLLYDENWKLIVKVPVKDLANYLQSSNEPIKYVIFDGVITQRLVEVAEVRGIKALIGGRIGNITHRPMSLEILTFSDLGL